MTIFSWILCSLAGYCLVCWAIGAYRLRHLFRRSKMSWKIALLAIAREPIYKLTYLIIKAVAIVWIWILTEKFWFHIQLWWKKRPAEWVAKKLYERGITVLDSDQYDYLHDQCEVVAELKPDQVSDYRDVYARAIRKYWRLKPARICGSAKPPAPLNREWAESIGLSEYFAEEFFSPCVDCQSTERWGRKEWGDAIAHSQLHDSDRVQTYYLKDGSTRVVTGHLCRRCVNKMEWTSASG